MTSAVHTIASLYIRPQYIRAMILANSEKQVWHQEKGSTGEQKYKANKGMIQHLFSSITDAGLYQNMQMNRYYTTNALDKRSIPNQNDKQNRVAFDHGNQVPFHSTQENLIRGVYLQNFKSINMKLPRKISKLAATRQENY